MVYRKPKDMFEEPGHLEGVCAPFPWVFEFFGVEFEGKPDESPVFEEVAHLETKSLDVLDTGETVGSKVQDSSALDWALSTSLFGRHYPHGRGSKSISYPQ